MIRFELPSRHRRTFNPCSPSYVFPSVLIWDCSQISRRMAIPGIVACLKDVKTAQHTYSAATSIKGLSTLAALVYLGIAGSEDCLECPCRPPWSMVCITTTLVCSIAVTIYRWLSWNNAKICSFLAWIIDCGLDISIPALQCLSMILKYVAPLRWNLATKSRCKSSEYLWCPSIVSKCRWAPMSLWEWRQSRSWGQRGLNGARYRRACGTVC